MNFLFILASLISIPAFGGEFPNSPANNFSAVEEERIRVRGVLEDLEKKLSADPGNRALIQELKKASEHQAMLAAELVKLHQSKISITQNSTKKTEDSEELQINVLRVEATLKFLDQLVEESGAKLNLKISKAPFEYDNRHFLFVRKKRKFNKDSSKIAVQILDQQRKSIREFQIRASERIHTLQARSQSAHLETLESLQLNLKEMELLRQQIVQTTYNMEAEMNQILENIKFLQKLNPKLTKYYSKILNASYVPHGLNAVESEEYTASKEEALHQVKEILSQARNSELILKLIPSELETNLLSKLDQVIDTYNERAALYISEKGGVYGFLSNYRSSVNREINLTILWAAIHASFITNASIDFMSQFEVDSLNEKLATKLRSEIKKLKKDLIQGAEQEIKQGKAVLKDISSRHGQILKDSYSNLLFKVSKDFVHHWMSSSRTNFQRMQQKNLKSQNDETKSLLKEADRIYKTIEFSLKNDQTLEVLKNSFSQYTTDILKLKAALEKLINKELAAESQSQNRFNLEFKTHSDNFNRLSQKLAESQEITQHIISLSLSLNETGFQYIRYLNRKKDTLASEIKGIKNSLNFKLFSKSANIQYRLDSLKEGVADLTKTINQFSAIFGGLLEIKKTLDWAENFGKHLSDLTQILLGEKNEFVHWDDAVNVGKTELHNIAEGFAHFMRHEHQFNFLKFKFELDEGSKKIHDKIEEILGDTATLLIGLHFSYDQIYLNSNLWDIQDPATVGVKTLRLTRDLKNRPSGIPSEIVSAWRSFAGYISLALSTANPSNILPDELAQLFNSLDSKTNLSEIQADDHYLPPFAGANSESLPGLENFGNTCYLNAILKAVTTTSLQKVFSPTFKLVQRKDQTDPTQNESDEAFQMRLESQKTIALFLSTLGTQESAQWISSKFTKELSSTVYVLGKILRPIVQIRPLSAWKSEQQDADEALGYILNEFENQVDSFWKIGVERLSTVPLNPQKNSHKLDWERSLSVTIPSNKPNADLNIQSLINNSMSEESEQSRQEKGVEINYKTRQEVVTLPETLIVRINRFQYSGTTSTKLDQTVNFMNGVTLQESELVRNSKNVPISFEKKQTQVFYKPKGVIYHIGPSAHEGHYIYASFEKDGKVVVHNDDNVKTYSNIYGDKDLRATELKTILKNGYLIFFEKQK